MVGSTSGPVKRFQCQNQGVKGFHARAQELAAGPSVLQGELQKMNVIGLGNFAILREPTMGPASRGRKFPGCSCPASREGNCLGSSPCLRLV